jgi:hypothetical protein
LARFERLRSIEAEGFHRHLNDLAANRRRRKKPRRDLPGHDICAAAARERIISYLSCDDTLLKFVFSVVPIVFTATIIATEIPAAMRPYSIAVAPDRSVQKRTSIRNMTALSGVAPSRSAT